MNGNHQWTWNRSCSNDQEHEKIEVVTNYNRLESLMLSPTELKIEVVIKENQKWSDNQTLTTWKSK